MTVGAVVHGRRVLAFSWRVLRRFLRHRGLLLSSAVAFNALLSIVPLLGLALVLLSHFVDRDQVRALAESQLEAMLPRSSEPIAQAFAAFADERAVAGGVGAIVLLVFSAMAFRTLDQAIAALFESPRERRRRRHVLAGVLVPLAYVGLVAGALLIATLLGTVLDMLPEEGLVVRGHAIELSGAARLVFRVVTFVATVGVLASFYRVMPRVHVRFRHALAGGLASGILWELARRLLVTYFEKVSLVGVIYGSLATFVVLLLTFEVGAIIVLLGAQTVAEVTRSHAAGLPWYEEPSD